MKRVVKVALVCTILVGASGWLAGGFPLNIVVEGAHATAHMELLGEYPNDINLIELQQLATSKVVWRVVAEKKMVQLHKVPFVVGSNPADLRTFWGHAKTELPSNSSEFVLMPNTEYKLLVCPSSWWRRCVSEVFHLERA